MPSPLVPPARKSGAALQERTQRLQLRRDAAASEKRQLRREREKLKEDTERLEEMAEELQQKSGWVAAQHAEASSMLAEVQHERRQMEELGTAIAGERDELLHLEATLAVGEI